jgi:hypothetical protein
VALGVVVLDVKEVGRVLERRVVPVQVAHPVVHVRVSRTDVSNVALEMLHIDGLRLVSFVASLEARSQEQQGPTYIKADDCHEPNKQRKSAASSYQET